MSLVHKIPPLVSALAFGYGVGMAAPESTISTMKEPFLTHAQIVDGPPLIQVGPKSPMSANVGRVPPNVMTGDESRELGRLRQVQLRESRDSHDGRDGRRSSESCDLDRPSFSRPHFESTRDHLPDDVDDLDSAGSEALSKLQLPDLKIPITRRTLKYVKFFTRTDRGRGMFETWLKRSGRYQEVIQGELRERRLPDDLIWVAMIESGFDARAKSPAGAVGLWQFMPATGEVYGLQQSRFMDQRKNPRLATQAAAHHLHDLYMRFGSWDLALAAYNMGYEQLLDAIDQYGTADFNELARQEAVPSETSAYVPKIAAAAIVANNLEHFGFDKVEISRPLDSSEIAVPPGTPLRTLAKASGVSTAAIRALNPDILGERVPPGRGDYLVLIPSDTVSRARASLPMLLQTEPIVTDDASVLDPVDLLTGRELTKRRSRSEDESLLSLLPSYRRRHTLRDPGSAAELDDRARDEEEPLDDEEPRRASPHHVRKHRETLMYKVGAGDSLASIARQFAMDVDDVAQQNHLDTDDKLKAGSLLKLRVRREFIDATSARDDKDKDDKDAASKPHPRAIDADEVLKPRHRKHHG